MKTNFIPEVKARTMKPEPNMALISVTQLGDTFIYFQPGWEDILRIQFDDVDTMTLRSFHPAQAEQIIEFVERNKDRDEIVVHCLAGISRSAAIAKFIAEKYNCEEWLSHFKEYNIYNKLVYRILNKTAESLLGPN